MHRCLISWFFQTDEIRNTLTQAAVCKLDHFIKVNNICLYCEKVWLKTSELNLTKTIFEIFSEAHKIFYGSN
jgi:hypothetical protein